MLVMKFGGSILKSSSDFLEISDYLKEKMSEERIVTVISAMKGVTDDLLMLGRLAASGKEKEVLRVLSKIGDKHLSICKELGLSCDDVKEELKRIERIVLGITYIGEITPRVTDLLSSLGENLSGEILTELLNKKGIRAKFFTGGEAGIITDDSYGEANPLLKATRTYVRRKLIPIIGSVLPIVAGFSGISQEGKITTLGRGGSDLTAVLLGSSLESREVWLWTDVDGLMTADPNIVRDAKVIKQASYQEAIELAHFGAKKMHPRFLEPAIITNTPIRIRNFYKRACQGTLISRRSVIKENIVKAVGLLKGISILTVRGAGMVGRPGTSAKLFSLLGENMMNILMISQSVSESDISLVLSEKKVDKAKALIETKLLGPVFREVMLDRKCAAIAAIGSGMRGTPGVAARIFKAVSSKGINIKMIAQGSSETNISFVVNEEDGEEAVRSIHEEFDLGRGQLEDQC